MTVLFPKLLFSNSIDYSRFLKLKVLSIWGPYVFQHKSMEETLEMPEPYWL